MVIPVNLLARPKPPPITYETTKTQGSGLEIGKSVKLDQHEGLDEIDDERPAELQNPGKPFAV